PSLYRRIKKQGKALRYLLAEAKKQYRPPLSSDFKLEYDRPHGRSSRRGSDVSQDLGKRIGRLGFGSDDARNSHPLGNHPQNHWSPPLADVSPSRRPIVAGFGVGNLSSRPGFGTA